MYNPFKFKISKIDTQPLTQPRDWQLIARSYAAPIRQIPESLQDVGLAEKAMFGVTTILLQDTITGDIRKEEIVGSDENQLYLILEKAKQFGIQYINYNGERFAIAVVPKEENLPVK